MTTLGIMAVALFVGVLILIVVTHRARQRVEHRTVGGLGDGSYVLFAGGDGSDCAPGDTSSGCDGGGGGGGGGD